MVIDELNCTKTKKGWKCSDAQGRFVMGETSSIARRKWFQTYGIDREPKTYGFDMSNIPKNI